MSRLETADFIPSLPAVNPQSESFGGKTVSFIPEVSIDFEDEKPQEECGTTAIFNKRGNTVGNLLPAMQHELQHRGYDTAGKAVFYSDTREIEVLTGEGRVDEVFSGKSEWMWVDRGIAHNRYSTSGGENKDSFDGAQPMVATYNGRTVALSFNGNLPEEMREILRDRIPPELIKKGGTDTTELVGAWAAAEGKNEEDKIRNAFKGVTMAYSLTLMNDEGRVFGLRGPSGTWPLMVGETEDEIIISSESRVEHAFPGKEVAWREVCPGELVEATPEGVVSTQLFQPIRESICMLHAMYGAKGDSLMTEDATYLDFRKEAGRILATEYPIEADIIIGIPATGRHAALGYAEARGMELTDAVKLRDDKRSYIAKNPLEAAKIVNGKFEVDSELVKGKSAIVVEDSFIKGVTAGGDPMRGLLGTVQMLRQAGAREIHFLAALPKFIEGCDLGYVVTKDTLAALVRQEDGSYLEISMDQIAEKIGADSFGALSIEGMNMAVENITGKKDIACTACFGGQHPLEESREEYLVLAGSNRREEASVF